MSILPRHNLDGLDNEMTRLVDEVCRRSRQNGGRVAPRRQTIMSARSPKKVAPRCGLD